MATSQLEQARTHLTTGYRRLGPEVSPTTRLGTTLVDKFDLTPAAHDALIAELVAAGDAEPFRGSGPGQPAGYALTPAFRWSALRGQLHHSWVEQRPVAPTDTSWRAVARRQELVALASAAWWAGDLTDGIRLAADAACGSPETALRLAVERTPTREALQLLLALAEQAPVRLEHLLVLLDAIAPDPARAPRRP